MSTNRYIIDNIGYIIVTDRLTGLYLLISPAIGPYSDKQFASFEECERYARNEAVKHAYGKTGKKKTAQARGKEKGIALIISR